MSDHKDWLARDVLIVGELSGAYVIICESAESLHEVQGEEATAPVPFEDAPEFERMSYEELEAWAMHAWYDEAYARDENRRLRELVEELYPLADYGAMDASELDRAHDLMRELGIEVDG